MLITKPAVFIVGDNYQIMTCVDRAELIWVKVGDKEYFDASNGVMRTGSLFHSVSVPKEALDNAGGYTVYERGMIGRKPYFSVTGEVTEQYFSFKPVPTKGEIRAYHIADAHNRIESPIKAAKAFGAIDFLILNGDLPDSSSSLKNIENVYILAGEITGGNIPVIFSRGNHDMRGICAENFADCTPTDNGKSYFTFSLGNIWGIVLDCAEDKPDSHEEYGFTVACHSFREAQTDFIKNIVSKKPYEADGIEKRVVIVHNPFTDKKKAPFDIEGEIYAEWSRLLKEYVKPDVMICGHKHICGVFPVGDILDYYGQPCTIVVGAKPEGEKFTGCGYVFSDDGIKVSFTSSTGVATEFINVE